MYTKEQLALFEQRRKERFDKVPDNWTRADIIQTHNDVAALLEYVRFLHDQATLITVVPNGRVAKGTILESDCAGCERKSKLAKSLLPKGK